MCGSRQTPFCPCLVCPAADVCVATGIRSAGPAEAETGRGVGGREPIRLAQRRADEHIPVPALPAAAQAEHRSGQVVAKLPLGGLSANVAVVGPQVGFLTATQPQRKIIAQQPAALTAQRHLPIEAAYGVAPADGEAILRHQWRAAPLRAPGAAVAQALRAELERQVEPGI